MWALALVFFVCAVYQAGKAEYWKWVSKHLAGSLADHLTARGAFYDQDAAA